MGIGKKIKAAVIGYLCVATLTAVTMHIKGELDKPIPADKVAEMSETIDNCDLSNKESVASLAMDMNEWCEDAGCEFQSAHLERVVDGDTIVVDIDGFDYKVRLIGVNTPESVASVEYLEKTGKENTQEGKDASSFTKNLLADTDIVYLQCDTADTDKYDRLLRYVWLEIPEDEMNIDEIETKMLNALLVEEGWADVETYKPNTKYEKQLKTIEQKR